MSRICFSTRVSSARANLPKGGNCRQLQISSRGRSYASARRLDKEWRELRMHATIEKDSEKMLRLTAERNESYVLAKAADTENDN